MARKYVVIDTNVLVSALITRNESSPTVQILRFLATGNIVPVYSDEIVKEYNEVLRRAKFKLPESIIINLLKDIMDNGLKFHLWLNHSHIQKQHIAKYQKNKTFCDPDSRPCR